jgi:tRNA(Ile)-lysidine synthase TilS/MesJ
MSSSVVLFSGGLDSTLSARILLEQGISVIGVNFVTPFHDASAVAGEQAAALGIELITHRTGDEYIRLIANPRWGYGKAVNPCVDCRVAMCRVAAEIMRERNLDFVATGEIAGQRPNSQMQHQLSLIARESELSGFLVRPLTAKVIEPTEAERLGLVNRDRLYGYTGRGRGHLVAMAKRLGIKKIPPPSTGCALCEKSYAPRIRDLFKYELNPSNWDAEILNAGRQIRLNANLKAVVARNECQCNTLNFLYNNSDARPALLFMPESFNAPTAMIIGVDKIENEILQLGESLILEFTNLQKVGEKNRVIRVKYGNKTQPAEIIYQNQNVFQKQNKWKSL